MNVVRSVAIKTHRNSDGTFDASIGGERMGLKCLFYVSARVQALRSVAVRLENEGVQKASLLIWERSKEDALWLDLGVHEYLACITRVSATIRYNATHHGQRGIDVFLHGMPAEVWMLKLSDASRL